MKEFVVGGAPGVDTVAEEWATANGFTPTVMLANWLKHGRSAGFIRNAAMARYVKPDGGLIVIWDGTSRGSQNMHANALSEGLEIFERIIQKYPAL